MDLDSNNIKGHDILALERYMDTTQHMIEFDVLRTDSPVGNRGERLRQFLSDAGYAKALGCQKCKQIKIRRHAFVIEGNLIYDSKKNKPRR